MKRIVYDRLEARGLDAQVSSGAVSRDSARAGIAQIATVTRERIIDRAFQQAFALERSGQLVEAAARYRVLLLEHGPDADVCYNLGNVLRESGRVEAAIERYRQTVELSANFAAAWNNLGLSLAELGDGDGAMAAWRSALAADTAQWDEAEWDAVYNLADALHDAGRMQEARRHWQRYLDWDPESPWGEYARACLAMTP